MTSLDSVKRGSGPTIIGGSAKPAQPLPVKKEVVEMPKREAPLVPNSVSTQSAALQPRQVISSSIPQKTQPIVASNTLKLPPKPTEPPVRIVSTETPQSKPVVPEPVTAPVESIPKNTAAAYIPEQKNTLKAVVMGARQTFIKKDSQEPVPKLENPAVSSNPYSALMDLPQPPPATAIQPPKNQVVTVPEEMKVAEEPVRPKKKIHRIPVYVALVALVGALSAVGVTYFVTRQGTPSQASTSSSAAANSISATTFLAKNSLDPDKKEQKDFKKGDPIQICINYESQSNTSVIEIKITREVDGGSQLEIIATRLNAVGTDTRCLPFTGVQAIEGKYTVTLGNSTDSSGVFKKVAESKFAISAASDTKSN